MASDKSHAELIASLREWCEKHQVDIVQYNVIKYALDDLEAAHKRDIDAAVRYVTGEADHGE